MVTSVNSKMNLVTSVEWLYLWNILGDLFICETVVGNWADMADAWCSLAAWHLSFSHSMLDITTIEKWRINWLVQFSWETDHNTQTDTQNWYFKTHLKVLLDILVQVQFRGLTLHHNTSNNWFIFRQTFKLFFI